MKMALVVGVLLMVVAAVLTFTGCDKERIVESTEYVREYVELPPDTVWRLDTVIVKDSVTIYTVDTVFQHDTVVQVNHVFDTVNVHDTVATVAHHYDTVTIVDTVVQITQVYDTLFVTDTIVTVQHHYHYDTVTVVDTVIQGGGTVYDTVVVVDTIVTVQHHYDTTYVVDTVQIAQCSPNEFLAFTALQYYSDPLVIDAINSEFGINDGWVFYLSAFQHEVTRQSADTYDIYGLIDYWTPDWSAFYPFEFFWRMKHIGGDPAVPTSWQMLEPPGYAPGLDPGLNLTQDRAPHQPINK